MPQVPIVLIVSPESGDTVSPRVTSTGTLTAATISMIYGVILDPNNPNTPLATATGMPQAMPRIRPYDTWNWTLNFDAVPAGNNLILRAETTDEPVGSDQILINVANPMLPAAATPVVEILCPNNDRGTVMNVPQTGFTARIQVNGRVPIWGVVIRRATVGVPAVITPGTRVSQQDSLWTLSFQDLPVGEQYLRILTVHGVPDFRKAHPWRDVKINVVDDPSVVDPCA